MEQTLDEALTPVLDHGEVSDGQLQRLIAANPSAVRVRDKLGPHGDELLIVLATLALLGVAAFFGVVGLLM